MKRLLASLYEDSETATAVMHALHDEGFKSFEIECIESPAEDDQLFRRPLFTDGRGEVIRADSAHRALTNFGIPQEDAPDYVEEIRRGRSLVLLRCEETRAPLARDVMNRVPLERAAQAAAGHADRPRNP